LRCTPAKPACASRQPGPGPRRLPPRSRNSKRSPTRPPDRPPGHRSHTPNSDPGQRPRSPLSANPARPAPRDQHNAQPAPLRPRIDPERGNQPAAGTDAHPRTLTARGGLAWIQAQPHVAVSCGRPRSRCRDFPQQVASRTPRG
jgi:hypothetical protein